MRDINHKLKGKKMSGYNNYSMSNNAVDAYNAGLLPASKLARKLKVSPLAIKTVLKPNEWHHTSSHYNCTNFYNGELLVALANNTVPTETDFDDLCDAAESLLKMRKLSLVEKATPSKKIFGNITWLEWSGPPRRPVATEHVLDKVEVEVKGQFYIFEFKGQTIRKKIGSQGTYFFKR